MTNQYRCETCSHYLKYAIACDKIKERLIVGADEWIDKVGCASHSDFQKSALVNIRENPALDTIKQSEREKVLDELIDHYEKLIESGKGVTYNHPITYEWMYRGIVVDYLKGLRARGDRE